MRRALHVSVTTAMLLGCFWAGSGPASAGTSCFGLTPTLSGDERNNALEGTPGRDVVYAGAGNDLIVSLGGNDVLCGGSGVDIVEAGRGNDLVAGGPGVDLIVGEQGADSISGGADEHALAGGGGSDSLSGDEGRDIVSFEKSSHAVDASLALGRASGQGNDSLAGVEAVIGSRHSDRLTGDGRTNLLVGMLGDDTLEGGGGFDTVSYELIDFDVQIDLAQNEISGQGADRLVAIDKIIGSRVDDVLKGDANANRIDGGGGEDEIDGRAGDDVLRTQAPGPTVGGPGDDLIAAPFVDYSSAPGPVTVDLSALTASGDGNDTLAARARIVVGSDYDDRIIGDDGVTNSFYGGEGDDSIDARDGRNLVLGNAGNDTLVGGGALDEIEGGAGDDRIEGGGDFDQLFGGLGNDDVFGQGGDDSLVGDKTSVPDESTPGNDHIDGGDGVDTMGYGFSAYAVTVDAAAGTASGEGNDTFVAVERLGGSPFDDVMYGDDGPNTFFAEDGNDKLFGRDGDDFLDGGREGHDEIDGEGGRDTCREGEVQASCELT